eukprot:c16920_g2_i1.p1 GENE.c16920_g2_i1~~c16920_g2_i1.p1  ORF type:complete len:411 (-),score=78.89 c16920_g2_i1:170-1402(-)
MVDYKDKPDSSSRAANSIVFFALGIFAGIFLASFTWGATDTETRLQKLESSLRLSERLATVEQKLHGTAPVPPPSTAVVSATSSGGGSAAAASAKIGRMGRQLSSLSFEGESFRVTLVKIPDVPAFFMVDPNTLKVDNMLPYLQNSEQHLMEAFKRVLLRDPCYPGNTATNYPPCFARSKLYPNIGDRAVVLDVGSNSGFYSLLSASLGYRVIGVDPQPHCAQFVRTAVTTSGLDHLVTFHNAFAGTRDQPRDVMPRTGCWGTFPYVTDSQTESTNSLFTEIPAAQVPLKVPTIAVDDLVSPAHDVVVVMKVDVEGHEKHVFEGARRMLEARKILNMFVEWNKNQWKSEGVEYETVMETARWLMSLGYVFKVSNYGAYEHQVPFLDSDRLPTFFEEGWGSIDVHIYLPDQ